jgi:hypothetical protein
MHSFVFTRQDFFLSKPGQEKTEADPLYQIEHALNRKPLNRKPLNRLIA